MRIGGMMVVGPNEKYLDKSLNELKRLCDVVIVATNNADWETKDKIACFGFQQYEDNREWGIYQPDIKTHLLSQFLPLQVDWIIAIDADEVFAPEFTREEAERLASGNEIAYNFLVVNLYNDEQHFAHSTGIQRFWNIRFFKFMPEYGLQYVRKNLHCGLAPPIAYKYGWHAPYYLLHYGLMLPEDRIRKAERYKKYDPTKKFKGGTYYEQLESELPMLKFDPQGLLGKLRESKETQPRKRPALPKCE